MKFVSFPRKICLCQSKRFHDLGKWPVVRSVKGFSQSSLTNTQWTESCWQILGVYMLVPAWMGGWWGDFSVIFMPNCCDCFEVLCWQETETNFVFHTCQTVSYTRAVYHQAPKLPCRAMRNTITNLYMPFGMEIGVVRWRHANRIIGQPSPIASHYMPIQRWQHENVICTWHYKGATIEHVECFKHVIREFAREAQTSQFLHLCYDVVGDRTPAAHTPSRHSNH